MDDGFDYAEPGDWRSFENNPHSRQVWDQIEEAPRSDISFSRVLEKSMPRIPYKKRSEDEESTVVHWGQRKLLMCEAEFLTLYSSPGQTVVYVGAAPGTHIAYLSTMFPDLHFLCVDPAPFNIEQTDRITLFERMFTDVMARKISSEHPQLLFICDVRTADHELDKERDFEAKVAQDMANQKKWHGIMRPIRSLLKFRLPYASGVSMYLDGDVYLPVWGPGRSTECRLITKENSNEVVEYDHKEYEEQMSYFNKVVRPALYNHHVVGEGIDHCYDCRTEIHILSRWLIKFKGVSYHDLADSIQAISQTISQKISKDNRTLMDPTPDYEERKKVIKRNQWKHGKPASWRKMPNE